MVISGIKHLGHPPIDSNLKCADPAKQGAISQLIQIGEKCLVFLVAVKDCQVKCD